MKTFLGKEGIVDQKKTEAETSSKVKRENN